MLERLNIIYRQDTTNTFIDYQVYDWESLWDAYRAIDWPLHIFESTYTDKTQYSCFYNRVYSIEYTGEDAILKVTW